MEISTELIADVFLRFPAIIALCWIVRELLQERKEYSETIRKNTEVTGKVIAVLNILITSNQKVRSRINELEKSEGNCDAQS